MNNEQYGILDTCVLIDIENIEASALPEESYITTISLAELAAGPHAAQDPKRTGAAPRPFTERRDTF